MHAELPVHRVLGALEVREQRHRDLERGQLAQRDGREAVVGERGGQRVGAQAGGERLGLEGADAAAEGFGGGGGGDGVPLCEFLSALGAVRGGFSWI